MDGNQKHNDGNDFEYYRYDPSLGAAITFVALFLIFTLLHTYKLVARKPRTLFFIPFVIGGLFEWVGYIGRIIAHVQTPDWTLGPFIMQSILLLVAPALFAATIYMELGRIIQILKAEKSSPISPRWLTKVFVAGDVLSFFAQGAGGGLLAGDSQSSIDIGQAIIVAGLGLQLLFFGLFVAVAAKVHIAIHRKPTATSESGQVHWKWHMFALYAASALILIRSTVRIIEFAQGNDGFIISHEIFLYLFDGLPMFLVMVIFFFIYPKEIQEELEKDEEGGSVKNRLKGESRRGIK